MLLYELRGKKYEIKVYDHEIRYTSFKKKNRMQELKKVRIQKKINNSREYLIVANRISGQKRIESREKINKLLAEKTNGEQR